MMAGNAHAEYKNKDLYAVCKIWEENDFKDHYIGERCRSYILGIADAGMANCVIVKTRNPPTPELKVLQRIFAAGRLDINAKKVAKQYMKTIERDPAKANNSAAATVMRSIQVFNPCL